MYSTAKYHFLVYFHAFPTLLFLLYSPGLVTLFMQWETLPTNVSELWWLQSSGSIWCSWFLMQEKEETVGLLERLPPEVNKGF